MKIEVFYMLITPLSISLSLPQQKCRKQIHKQTKNRKGQTKLKAMTNFSFYLTDVVLDDRLWHNCNNLTEDCSH
jgi:hypothetical protein